MKPYIGSYRIERELGTGGFGVVYEAYQPFLDRKVAIKTLHTDLTSDSRLEQQFMHEARTIARLRHHGIVSVYEFGTVPAEPTPQTYMVMEYLAGETLEQRLKRETLPLSEIVRIVEALAQALDYAHERSVIHRDLKPANILFSENNEPVIVDFGLAKLIEIGTGITVAAGPGETTTSGTPTYMAPEQLMSAATSGATDQYALALIAYRMLTGHLPHEADSLTGLIAERLRRPPNPASLHVATLPKGIDDIFTRAFANDPADRCTSAGEFARAFGDVLLPDREKGRVVTVIDPLQAALIEATRRMMRSFLLVLAGIVALVMLYCLSLFLRGVFSGTPSFFVWDGLITMNPSEPDGKRLVTGVWWNSPAERAGIRVGDVIVGDLLYNEGRDGDFLVNGVSRASLPRDWQRHIGDKITRPLLRNGQSITVNYELEPTTYFLIPLILYLIPALVGFVAGLWLLQRWGAEPGLQIFFPLLLAVSFFMLTRVLVARPISGGLIPYLDTLVVHVLFPALIHFMLIFPAPAEIVHKHPRWIGVLYLPIVTALFSFMTGQGIFITAGLQIQLISYLAWGTCILMLLIFKWMRHDLKRYRSLIWFIAGFAVIPPWIILDSIWLNIPYSTAVQVFGDTRILLLVMPIQTALAGSLAIALCAIGYHRVQSTMGETLSIAQLSRSIGSSLGQLSVGGKA